MGRSKETFGKKAVRNKKQKKKKEKAQRREEKREQGSRSFDEMIAWVDENGNIVSSPPDPEEKTEIDAESIEVGVPKEEPLDEDGKYTGKISNFDEARGFGFINCIELNDSVFVHANDCNEPIGPGDKVEFEVEKTARGLKANQVKLIK